MGCASSKKLKKQAIAEARDSPPSNSRVLHDQTFEDYHRHLAALSPCLYSLLKVDSSEQAEEAHKKRVGVASFKEMYEKLISFEDATRSASKAGTEVSNKPEILQPGLDGISSRLEQRLGNSNAEVAGDPQIIDLKDIMHGLDEEAPPWPSHVKTLGSTASKGVLPTKLKPLNNSFSFHTVVEDLEDGQGLKDSKVPVRDAGGDLFMSNGGDERNEFGEEKATLLGSAAHGQSSCTDEDGDDSPRTGPVLRSSLVQPQMNATFFESLPGVIQDNNNSIKENVESRHTKDTAMKTASGKSSKSSITLNGNAEFALNEDNNSNSFMEAPSMETSLMPGLKNTNALPRTFWDAGGLPLEPNDTLFDADLVASYEKVLENFSEDQWNDGICDADEVLTPGASDSTRGLKEIVIPVRAESMEISPEADIEAGSEVGLLSTHLFPAKAHTEKQYAPLEKFEEKCPPGGERTLVLYTTTLRGIRKTFEDCNSLRELVQSFGLSIDERDVSMHLAFRNELSQLLGGGVCLPRLFIKGRYIGGAEEVANLHEHGKLVKLLEGIPTDTGGGACDGCGGVRFVPCLECSGSCRIVNEDNKVIRCPSCNENGLIQCPICC